MAQYRISARAKKDLANLLHDSAALHGADAPRRYGGLIAASFRRIAADPHGLSTLDRSEVAPGLRSLHLRHSGDIGRDGRVAKPVYIVFYRLNASGLVEIVRVLHPRMDLSRPIGASSAE